MSFHHFIMNILNIEPDRVESLTSIPQSDSSILIKIRLTRDSSTVCPFCKGAVNIHGYNPRKLIHSTLVNRKCTIVYFQRRYKCNHCNISFSEKNPFINTKENVTIETKINVLKDLKFTNNTYSSVAKRYHLSVTKVQRIFDYHVHIERKPLPTVLSIDEHYFPESNYDSLYCCLLMDFNDGTLIDILPDRKKDYLLNYFGKIKNSIFNQQTGLSELNNVKYISIDLYDTYKSISKTYFPHALICADSFHVIKHLTESFRQVRLNCRKNTKDENLQYLLTKFKYVFNHNIFLDNQPKFNKRMNRYLNHRDILELLFTNFPKLKIAYTLKEAYISFNETCTIEKAKDQLTNLIQSFADSNIDEYTEFYNLLIHWYQEIVNSFSTVNNRRINNSYIESRNNQLEKLFFQY